MQVLPSVWYVYAFYLHLFDIFTNYTFLRAHTSWSFLTLIYALRILHSYAIYANQNTKQHDQG